MNIHFGKFHLVALTFGVGALFTVGSFPSLENSGKLSYEPNPGALAGSPFGRTVGMALQGPIVRFWDRGVGSIEGKPEELEGSRPDQKLFNWVNDMRQAKTDLGEEGKLYKEHKGYIMGRIEKKLDLAWKMDPRNFANYGIYQMFLWENFSGETVKAEMSPRELSLKTLEASLADRESPLSLLTAGQASYDLVFAARTSQEQDYDESMADIKYYGSLLPDVIEQYESMVDKMQADGRWDQYSEVKKMEFDGRRRYLDKLNAETRKVLGTVVESGVTATGGDQS